MKTIYPAAATVNVDIEITNIKTTKLDGVWTGHAILPEEDCLSKIVIYAVIKEDESIDYRAISAYCPHQHYDISKEPLKEDGNIYCSLHRRPICIYSEYNMAYPVTKNGNDFILKANAL